MRFLFLFFVLFCFAAVSFSQTCKDASVELSAAVQTSPPQISLTWSANAGATQYQVFRKLKSAGSWGPAIATYPGTTNQHTDANASIGESYEYKVVRSASNYTGYGYIHAGIEIPVVENRGKLILIVDNTLTTACETELSQFVQDLEGDGWTVIRHDVAPTDAVTSVKALIVSDYYQAPAQTQAVFLLGHVPVPYSGNLYPDGHPDHQGAWPADVYYADMDGSWTDYIVNNTVANDSRNDNIPGDGKFDQSSLPSDVELQIGRVDFNNMPSFTAGPVQLIKNYLTKNHQYRHKTINPVYQALVDDNFGYFNGEAFAASGWKNFGPLVNPANVNASDYFTSLPASSYLWSYGCGGGWYQGASGVGNSSQFASANLQGIFTLLFGSYFGDWDSQDNFLRAPLAQGQMLTNAWSGRPHWQFHPMGLGETIGYCARLTQNNNGLYYAGYGARFVHIALMGDPSLRQDIVAPPQNVTAGMSGNHCVITWNASPDATAGYFIYMKNQASPAWIRLNATPLTGLSYTDSCLADTGTYTYSVKALKLETRSSGSYYNLSQGISDTARNITSPEVSAGTVYSMVDNIATFTNTSVNASQYSWDFGDGTGSTEVNPVHAFNPGIWTVILTAGNDCSSATFTFTVTGSDWNSLSGQVRYANSQQSPLAGVMVHLSDTNDVLIAETLTDAAGNYSFSNLPAGSFHLYATSMALPGGFNSTDALLTLKHFVNMSSLAGLPLEAADVDNSQVVNALDALLISKRFTGQLSSFMAGSWYFTPSSITLGATGTYTAHLQGICFGDVNASWGP